MTRPDEPLVTIVLPTDRHATIAPVLDRLRRLQAPERLEVILVSPETEVLRAAVADEYAFHSVRVCHTDALGPLGAARAIGVRHASAPYVFLGETHSYLWPDALDPLLTPLQRDAADVTVPGFVNGNPTGSFSWAAFLAAYSRWGAALDPRLLTECPAYDFVARRDVLTDTGSALPTLLSDGVALNEALRARGGRILAVPEARIDHVNIEAAWPCLHELYLIGISIGTRRAAQWSLPRRLVYIAGSWLVPAVLLTRTRHGILAALRTERIPVLALPTMLLLFAAKALGEVVGCVGGGRSEHDAMQARYEIRRLDYASPCLPR